MEYNESCARGFTWIQADALAGLGPVGLPGSLTDKNKNILHHIKVNWIERAYSKLD